MLKLEFNIIILELHAQLQASIAHSSRTLKNDNNHSDTHDGAMPN